MKNYFVTPLGRLRLIGFLEGLSFLLLLFVAMPVKYFAGIKEATMVPGMLHGVLFLLYILAVFQVREDMEWNWKTTFIALVASILPFGTFYADNKIFKPAKA